VYQPLSLGAGNPAVSGVGDIDLINSGDIVLGEKFGYENLVEKVRFVAGGFRLIKTSKSENESGQIRAMYNASGDGFGNSTIDQYAKRLLQTDSYREIYPAEHSKSGGALIDVNYIPQQQADIDEYYDTPEPFLTNENRVYAYENKPLAVEEKFIGNMLY
jgi:hypothetical protein